VTYCCQRNGLGREFHNVLALALLALGGIQTVIIAEELNTMAEVQKSLRVPLALGQNIAVLKLQQARPISPVPLFLATDPNKDPDDLIALVHANYLQRQGFVDLRCVVTTLGDREMRTTRARFAKSVLDDLGLGKVKVGVGVDYSFEVYDKSGAVDVQAAAGRKKDHQVFLETPLLREQAVVELDGLSLLKNELEQVPDHAAVWLINSGMADLAALLRVAPGLVKQKTAKVVIMGGVGSVDEQGFAVADQRAYNNTTHQDSADFVYRCAQELGLPLVVVTKEAAYAASSPRTLYDGMAATQNPIGVYLQKQQKESLAKLWDGIHQGHAPPALNTEWFLTTFTDVDLTSPTGKAVLSDVKAHDRDFEKVWKLVSKFNLYDPLALLAATPGAAELVYRRETLPGVRGNVQIVRKESIKDSQLIKDLLAGMGIESLNTP
jgi:inosine-uridine nucleoside N-ribohydrolase